MRLLFVSFIPLLCSLATASPAIASPEPTSTAILNYIDPPPSSSDNYRCSALMTTTSAGGSEPYLAFPNARITHESSGTIDCPSRVTLQASQTGYRYSVTWALLSGYLKLEPGAFIERFNVSLEYFPADQRHIDVATARNLYGKYGTGYEGYFNMSIPFEAGGGDGKLSSTACRTSTSDPQTGIAVSVFVSLAHEMVGFDDMTPHYGTVGGDSPDSWLKVGFEGRWEKC